jgi:hypothetical protein
MQEKVVLQAKEAGFGIVRNNIRRTVVDEAIAKVVWSAVKNCGIPEQLQDGRKLIGVRTKMFFYKYSPGQFFSTHLDGGHRFRNTGKGKRKSEGRRGGRRKEEGGEIEGRDQD